MKAEVKITVGGHPYYFSKGFGYTYIMVKLKGVYPSKVVGRWAKDEKYVSVYNKSFNGVHHHDWIDGKATPESLENAAKRIYEFRLYSGWET
jgi:hypothetical protein